MNSIKVIKKRFSHQGFLAAGATICQGAAGSFYTKKKMNCNDLATARCVVTSLCVRREKP
jgi:hypothetical protein